MSARKVLAIAAGEIGYSRWNDPKRGTKYARETQPVLWPNEKWLLASGVAYCDIFVTWVFWKAGCLDILPGKQSYNVNYRASHGGHVSKSQAQPGDVLVFDWDMSTKRANHVGILEECLASGNWQTVEGNTTTGTRGNQSNGGRVAARLGGVEGYREARLETGSEARR
ncbi:MAG: CHAP domain-containing protein [Dermabacter sp.]|nr:CHAP domain-containing protein [Dermabacter sp.]